MVELRLTASSTAESADTDGGRVTLQQVDVDGSTLTVSLTATGKVDRFLTDEPVEVTYPTSLAAVPEGILVVPALAQVCPVAWATGADVVVDRVDPEFLVSLYQVGTSLQELYPSVMRGGEIHADSTPVPEGCERLRTGTSDGGTEDSALLFSGGVDSLASYVRHRGESPLLVSIRGWGPDDTGGRDHVQSFADRHGSEAAFLRSNVRSALDTALLNAHFEPHVGGSWDSAVGHGLGLLGLCAPLCYDRGIETLYIPATHSESFTEPWGSHPTIDDNVSWTGTNASHDCYDLTRRQKVESIAEFIEERDPDLQVRTCAAGEGNGENCSRCEKCYRTIVELTVAGVDPREHGYDVTPSTFPDVRRGFESGRWALAAGERVVWEDLQATAPAESPLDFPGADDFFAWLARADVEELVAQSNSPLSDRVLRGVARRSPNVVYRSLYPLYRRAQNLLQ